MYPCCCVQSQTSDSSATQLQGPRRQILRAIYHKWQRQIQRWADYRSLFSLMGFIAVFLGVLYAQRGATVGYQVHSTIAAVVVPGNTVLQSTADVYSWLQGLLQVRAAVCLEARLLAGGLVLKHAYMYRPHVHQHARSCAKLEPSSQDLPSFSLGVCQ